MADYTSTATAMDKPDYRGEESREFAAAAALPRDLMEGTPTMRKRGELWTPRWPLEPVEAHRARLLSSVLYNAFRGSVQSMAGRVFDQPMALEEKTDAKLRDWSDDVDLTGRSLTVFARDLFVDGLTTGMSGILTDKPVNKAANRGQELAAKLRPYWSHVRGEDILGWRTALVGGKETLVHLRIEQCTMEPKGKYGEQKVRRVREYNLDPANPEAGVQWTVHREVKAGKWQVDTDQDGQPSEGVLQLPRIPFQVFYANRRGVLCARSPLQDLAYLNLTHWQSYSDQRNILHIIRVGVLFGEGIPEDKAIKAVGSGAFLGGDTGSDLKWVEHSGQAVGAGRQDLMDLVEQMAMLGLEPLVSTRPGAQTATERAMDQGSANSTLEQMANDLRDAIESAFEDMASFENIEADVEVEHQLDLGLNDSDQASLQAVIQARQMRAISGETFLSELRRRKVLAPTVTFATEEKLLMEEGQTETPLDQAMMLAGAKGTAAAALVPAVDPAAASAAPAAKPAPAAAPGGGQVVPIKGKAAAPVKK